MRFEIIITSLKLIIRMFNIIYKTFGSQVVSNIYHQLVKISNSNNSIMVYATNIELRFYPQFKFLSDEVLENINNNEDKKNLKKYNFHKSDANFCYNNMYCPCAIIEVSYLQKKRDLKNLAKN